MSSHPPDQPVKRAPVVYGKRSNPLPAPSTVIPLDVQQQSLEYGRVRGPTTSPQRSASPSSSVHASDCERFHGPDTTDSFQFGFRHRLKELDREFDDHETQSSGLGSFPPSKAARTGLPQVKATQSISMATTILSSEPRCSSGDQSPVALSRSPASLHSSPARDNPLESPPVSRRTRRVQNQVLSDSGTEGQSNSPVSPVRHAITTPHSRSSPTPPTSSEVPMAGRKTKGKAPVRDVLPLLFEDEQSLATGLPTKSKKGRRSEPLARSKIKAPTKKERREVAFESSRIAANRPVEVIRTQEQKHSLSAFFAGLRRDKSVTSALGAELPSDPIEKFSSPTDNSTRVLPPNCTFGEPLGLLKTSAHVAISNQSSSSQTKVHPPAADDSDDEMPSVASIIQQENGKRERLRAMKQVALQLADTRGTFDINSEDDLLIVKDDMHSVAREEAVQRRLDKVHGSPVKDIATLRRISHPSVRPAIVSPHKFSKRELQEFAKPSFARAGKGSKGQLTKTRLDQLMIMQHTEEQLKSIKQHEEDWVKGGGRLSRNTDASQTSLSQKLEVYADLALKAVVTSSIVGDEASSDESDEDYTPNPRGSASPGSIKADKDNGKPSDSVQVSQLPRSPEDEGEEDLAPVRRNKPGQRHTRIVFGSDDEGEQLVHRSLPGVQRDSASSMESQTEDENDKENSAKLMYDRGEDKENKVVVRHELSSSERAFGSRPGFLHDHDIEDGDRRSLPLADNTTSPPKEDVRSPLKDISKDEDDLFLSSPSANSTFAERLLHSTAVSSPHLSMSTRSLGSPPVLRSERIGQINRLSFDSENGENSPSGFKLPRPSFLESLDSQFRPEPSFNPLPNDGFSQLFSAEEELNLAKPSERAENDELALTLDVGLKPALEVSETVRLKAETIFEKEQEYVVAAVQQNDKPKEHLYVNDHGFLTQTRPEGSSPQVYRMTPSQASKFIGTQLVNSTQLQPLSARPPLRTLSFTVSQGLSPEPQPLRRLHKRSPSPLEQKFLGRSSSLGSKLNAFDILGKGPKPLSREQEKHAKSEFVAVEAEESDEDDMFGFGGQKKDDEEEDNDQDKIVEGLVDDTVMDAETEAADLVIEKHREHEEEDDQRLQKLHQDAIEGKFRMKRRDRGVGFEDDSDDDEDDDARRIRQRVHKKRKIEGDSLEALGQSEETKAFYNTYHQDLIDEDDEFGHLREDVVMSAGDDDPSTTPEEQETVTMDEIRQSVREMAQNNLEVEALDPQDTSWIDQSMTIEADEVVRVKVVEHRRDKSTLIHPTAGQMDFDLERAKSHVENEQERKQLTSWAKIQSRWHQGTGRSGNSTAVTGHSKVKIGGGSRRSTQQSDTTRAGEAHKTKTSSLLSKVSPRRNKFM